MTRLTCEIFVGANCNVEYRQEGGERRFLAAFSEIQDISYETELMSRGRVTMDVKTGGMVGGACGGTPSSYSLYLFISLYVSLSPAGGDKDCDSSDSCSRSHSN